MVKIPPIDSKGMKGGALWKPGSKAYVCTLHYEGFQGSTRANPNELATDIVQAATAIKSSFAIRSATSTSYGGFSCRSEIKTVQQENIKYM